MNPLCIHPVRTLLASTGLLALLALASPAAGTTILIDLNENAGSGGPGGTWNTYATPANINGGTVLDANNLATSITFSVTGSITDNTSNGGLVVFDPNRAGVVGLPSWATSIDNNGASGDNFYTNNTRPVAESFTLTFGGLTSGSVISLDLLAARDTSAALGFYEYSLDGGSTWLGFNVLNADGTAAMTNGWNTNNTQTQAFSLQSQGFALHRYLNVTDVMLTGSTLAVRVTDGNDTTSTFASLNAMRLTVVPEPTSAALLLMGGLGFCGFARYRRRG